MPSETPHSEAAGDGIPPPPAGATLEAVLDAYLEELAAGRNPDQEKYLREYPTLADSLRGVFKTLDFVEATSRTLRAGRIERGARLGEYRIVREVARGGMGVVYEAVQTSLNRRVALKVLPAGAMLAPAAAERFAREAATAGRLHHTNIVPIYAVGEDGGVHYYAMQFIEGRSLADFLKTTRAAPAPPGRDYPRRVAHWGRQAADALAHAHAQGIVHRDVKPSNLLMDERDNVWISDFGLARADAMASLTTTGDVVGTARYMSPEQARGGRDHLDGRTDVYSLGATLYELLALTPAINGESREEVLSRIAFTDPQPLRQLNPAVPRDLETIVMKCLQKEPQRRYGQAGDVAEDLRRFLADEPIRARRTPPILRAARYVRRHRIHAAGALLAVTLAAAVLVTLRQVHRLEGEQRLAEAFDALLFDRDDRRAARLLDEAEGYSVRPPELYLYRGLIPLLDGQAAQAIPELERAWRRTPEHVELTLALACAHTSSGDFYTGRGLLARVPETRITSALGWLLRGMTQSRTQRSEAVEAYDRAVAVRPDFAPAIRARADYRGFRLLIEGDRAQLEPMLNDFDALVVFRPQSSESHAARAAGWLYAAAYAATQADLRTNHRHWLASAHQDMEAALALRRVDDARPLVVAGMLHRFEGDFRAASAAYAQALDAQRAAGGAPDPFTVHYYSLALHAGGDPQAALDALEPTCIAMPDLYSLQLQRALLLAEVGRLDEARAAGLACLRQQRSNANALLWSVGFMELLGAPEEAADALAAFAARDAAQITSEDARDTTYLPALAYLQGKLDRHSLLDAAQGAPGARCEYAFLIALRELGRGNRPAGLSALRACLDTQVIIYGDHRIAQTLLARAADPTWPKWIGAQAAESAQGEGRD